MKVWAVYWTSGSDWSILLFDSEQNALACAAKLITWELSKKWNPVCDEVKHLRQLIAHEQLREAVDVWNDLIEEQGVYAEIVVYPKEVHKEAA